LLALLPLPGVKPDRRNSSSRCAALPWGVTATGRLAEPKRFPPGVLVAGVRRCDARVDVGPALEARRSGVRGILASLLSVRHGVSDVLSSFLRLVSEFRGVIRDCLVVLTLLSAMVVVEPDRFVTILGVIDYPYTTFTFDLSTNAGIGNDDG